MVYAFDTLGYAKRLRDGGVPGEQAEAHAEAARDFIMAELFTKTDSLAMRQDIEVMHLGVDGRLTSFKQDMDGRFAALKQDMDSRFASFKQDMDGRFAALKQDMDARFAAFKQEFDARFAILESKIDALGLRLTVRLGAMLAAAVALLAALQKLS